MVLARLYVSSFKWIKQFTISSTKYSVDVILFGSVGLYICVSLRIVTASSVTYIHTFFFYYYQIML